MDEENRIGGIRFAVIAAVIGTVTAVSGLLVVLGWRLDVPVLKTFALGAVPMKANLAACFLLSGLALVAVGFSSRGMRSLAAVLSAVVVVVGTVTIAEIAFSLHPGFDEVLFRRLYLSGAVSGATTMALNAAICSVLVSSAIFALSVGWVRFVYPLGFLIVQAFSISFIGLVGFVFGLAHFSEHTGYFNMAVLAALLFLIMCAGVFLSFFARRPFEIDAEKKFFAGIVLAASVIVFVSLLTNAGYRTLRESTERTEHTQQVKNDLNTLLMDVLDIETGVRGFLISNDEEYLGFVNSAEKDLVSSMVELSRLLEDHEDQLARLDTLNRLIRSRTDHARDIREFVDSAGLEAGIALFQTGKGKMLTDRIRELVLVMKEQETRESVTVSEGMLSRSGKSLVIVLLNLLMQLAMLALVFVLIKRFIQQRKKTIDEISMMNRELEDRVEERTATLARSEEQFRSTLDNLMEGCQIIDSEFRYVYLNKVAVAQSRKSLDELVGKTMAETFPGIEKTPMFARLQECMEKRAPGDMLNEFEYEDGQKGWFQLKFEPVPEGVFIISIDVTDIRRAEDRLRTSNERFNRLVERLNDVVWTASVDGTELLDVNGSFTDLYGMEVEEFKSDPGLWLKMVHPDDKKIAEDSLAELSEQGVSSVEYRIVRPDGTVRWILDRKSLIYDDEGKAVQMGGIAKDVTERREAQEELIRHRDHLEELVDKRTKRLSLSMEETRDLYENAPCGYHSVDADGVIVRINNTELKWLGYARGEVVGKKKVADLLTPDSLKRYRKEFEEFMDKGEVTNREFEMVRKDGSTFFISVNAVAIRDDKGTFLMSRSTLFDVTERKQAEVALAAAKQDAEDANRAKSEFLANMSHEIRTPMNAVLGYTELLAGTDIDKTQKEYIDSISASGRSLLTLINDILDLSKIEAGKLELQYEFVDTRIFFSEFEKIFAMKISEKGLTFLVETTSGTPAGICIDEARVRQIVFNLIGNAIKFTEAGGITLNVYTENPRLVRYSKDNQEELIDLVLEVSDTGIGISKELQDEIFRPFTQEREYKHYGGTGLGLAITRRLAALMNGDVELKSVLGKGSTFTVRIPEIRYLREFTQEERDIRINPEEIVFGKALILVADDVEHNRKYLMDALAGTDLEVIEAEDGIEAYRLAKKHLPDLVIADIMMPKLDGFGLLEKIKTDGKLKKIPVLAYSASVLREQKERIFKSDFTGLLVKPVNVSELYLELMKLLSYESVKKDGSGGKEAETVELQGGVEDPEGLIRLLETDYKEIWKEFASRQPIEEVREFGDRLRELGRKHNSGAVLGYGSDLYNAADNFNIEAIMTLIRKFPDLVENLKT